MVGIVSEVVIPVKKLEGGGDRVFTIVCELVDIAQQTRHHHHHHHHHHHQDEQMEEAPQNATHLWKMASAWRVISFFVVVFVLPTVLISLPLYARYHLYHARHMPMTETDTRALNYAVSSFWCQGQRVSSNGSLDAYLVSGAPRVKEERRHVTLRRTLTLQHDDIEYWGVYLLKGSTFSVSSSARWPGGVMLVVQGEENLRKCFYKEEHLQSELDDPNGAVHRVHSDEAGEARNGKDGEDRIMDEERHWEEKEDNGGEVFDDVLDVLRQDEKDTQHAGDRNQQDVNEGLPPSEDETPLQTHKYDMDAKLEAKRRGMKGNMAKKKLEKSDTMHGRTRRSLTEDRQATDGKPADLSVLSDPRIPATDSLTPATDPMTLGEKLDLIRQLNESILFEAADESSYSSSEEFMEQCRNAILMADLTPYIQWQNHFSNLDNTSDSWTFSANSTDYFYFIFTSDNSMERNDIGFELDLQRNIFDVSAPLQTCLNATECVFPLAFTQTEAVVVEVPAGEHLHELHSFEVTTACQPRVPVYMVFILLVPFIILIFAFQ